MFFENLETERLLLKIIGNDDRDFIYNMFSNDIVNQYLFDAEPLTDISGADEIINFYVEPEPRNHNRWIIIRKFDNVKMGTCGFHCWDRNNKIVDIGYDLKYEFWGNGYMKEAIKKLIEIAKNKMKIEKINACIYTENKKSINLVKKLNFELNGTKNEIFRGKEYLHNLYTLSIK
jgi:ribosomal-protein-alanine N-acetyltransferase